MKKLSIEAIRCMLYPENETLWHELAARLGTSSNRVKYVYLPENRPGGPLTTTVAVEIISHFCNIDIENILENIEHKPCHASNPYTSKNSTIPDAGK